MVAKKCNFFFFGDNIDKRLKMGNEGVGRQDLQKGLTFVSTSKAYKPNTHSLTNQCGTHSSIYIYTHTS